MRNNNGFNIFSRDSLALIMFIIAMIFKLIIVVYIVLIIEYQLIYGSR